ncbi:pentapeptide repeat-containing protein [candidate division WOR-3 bacterium]|nr:pentapeptide repeat-containing protein [candidate division WOR-3 bacterium]
MAQKEGKRQKKLPDPKVWKWCKHPECLSRAKRQNGYGQGGKKEQNLMRSLYFFNAIFLEDYCWPHFLERSKSEEKAKTQYKKKIEKWVRDGHSLEDANFQEVDLSSANLKDAYLKGARFYGTNLEGTNLYDANLHEANFMTANLKKADLGWTILQETNLAFANLQEADLLEAELYSTILCGVKLNGAYNLTWKLLKKQVELKRVGKVRLGDEKEKWWDAASDAYCRLKNYFHQQGLYSDESKAYYREKLMSKHEAFWQCFKGFQPNDGPEEVLWKRFFPHLWDKVKDFFRWFWLWFSWWFAGFGERWWLTAIWALVVIAGFGGLYWLGSVFGWFSFNFEPGLTSHWFRYFYLSVVTFATLGFGDISPLNVAAQISAVIEVILGYLFLGTLVTLIAHKLRR